MSVEIAAADEFADQRVGSNELLVDNAEKLEMFYLYVIEVFLMSL